MGTVLKLADFSRRESKSVGEHDVPSEEGAEIVIFPGVRVEYHSIDLSARVKRPSKAELQDPKRKVE